MYVVIVKRIADVSSKVTFQQHLPDSYPVLCEEYDSLKEAQAEHPKKIVGEDILTITEYNKGGDEMQEIFEAALSEQLKPWWRFW
jgi:hypothetical protein